MKRFMKCLSLVLVMAMLIPTTTMAVEPRGSYYFMCSSVYLYREQAADRTFEVWFDVTATHSMEKLGASVIKVQRSSDGENWTTMRTYTKESYSQMICEDTIRHAACVTYTGTSGYYYRAYIELYAEDSSGTGEWYKYSSNTLHM